jgi:hypothetical protein
MAMKTPSQSKIDSSPVSVPRKRTPTTPVSGSPMISMTSAFHMKSIFSFLNALSCMIFDARKLPRRWMTVTREA